MTQLSPAMARALRGIADGDTRIDFIPHRHTWVTIKGHIVADTTLRALERRGYLASVRGRNARPSRKLTSAAESWINDQQKGLG